MSLALHDAIVHDYYDDCNEIDYCHAAADDGWGWRSKKMTSIDVYMAMDNDEDRYLCMVDNTMNVALHVVEVVHEHNLFVDCNRVQLEMN